MNQALYSNQRVEVTWRREEGKEEVEETSTSPEAGVSGIGGADSSSRTENRFVDLTEASPIRPACMEGKEGEVEVGVGVKGEQRAFPSPS